jgi:hypothetical protein
VVLKLGGWARRLQVLAIQCYQVTKHFTHTEGLQGPRTDLDGLEKRKLLPIYGMEARSLGRAACSLVVMPTELRRLAIVTLRAICPGKLFGNAYIKITYVR